MNDTRKRLPGEGVFCVLLLAFSVFVLYQAYGISGLSSVSAAGVFPMLAAAVMCICGVVTVLRTRGLPAPDTRGPTAFARVVLPPTITVFLALVVAYMLSLQWLGFLLSSFLFLLASIGYLYRRGPVLTLVVSAAALLAVWLVFRVVFSVVLPAGEIFR